MPAPRNLKIRPGIMPPVHSPENEGAEQKILRQTGNVRLLAVSKEVDARRKQARIRAEEEDQAAMNAILGEQDEEEELEEEFEDEEEEVDLEKDDPKTPPSSKSKAEPPKPPESKKETPPNK
jgi:hypothetical protein